MSAIEMTLEEIEQCDLRGYVGDRALEFAGQREYLVKRLGELCAADPEAAQTHAVRLQELAEATGLLRARAASEQRQLRQAVEELEGHWRQLRSFRPLMDEASAGVLNRLA